MGGAFFKTFNPILVSIGYLTTLVYGMYKKDGDTFSHERNKFYWHSGYQRTPWTETISRLFLKQESQYDIISAFF